MFQATNCCQPKHAEGFAAPLQAGVLNACELSWSVNESATPASLHSPPTSVSLVTPLTLGKDPTAERIPPSVRATKSVPPPTIFGPGPLAGSSGRCGPTAHGTSRHTVLGYDALKHPFLGKRARNMEDRQASLVPDTAAFAASVCGAGSRGVDAASAPPSDGE